MGAIKIDSFISAIIKVLSNIKYKIVPNSSDCNHDTVDCSDFID